MQTCAVLIILAAVAEGIRFASQEESERPTSPPKEPVAPSEVRIPEGIRTVWVDVGTAGRSDLVDNVKADPSIYFIGIEPTPEYVKGMNGGLSRSDLRERAVMVERACTREAGQKLSFYVHPQQECNSLNPTNPDSPPVKGGDCVGKQAQKITVGSATLDEVFRQLPRGMRVQLLKVDVQGHEWPCIEGAFNQLSRVDNIHLETQDIPPNTTAMYQQQLSLGQLDEKLRKLRFDRQYCESNSGADREMNCLYTRRGSTPLWVTGRPQRGGLAVKFDLDAPPDFVGVTFVDSFKTSNKSSAMAERLRGFGLLK